MVLTELTLVDELARLGIVDAELARFASSLLNTVGGATGTGSFFRPNVFLNPPFNPSFGDSTAPPAAPSASGALPADCDAVVGETAACCCCCCGVAAVVFEAFPLVADAAFLLLSLSLKSLNLSNIDF